MKDLRNLGFILLEENPPHESVLGSAGDFWPASGNLLKMAPKKLKRTNEPDTPLVTSPQSAVAAELAVLRLELREDDASLNSRETKTGVVDLTVSNGKFQTIRRVLPSGTLAADQPSVCSGQFKMVSDLVTSNIQQKAGGDDL